MTKRIKYPKFLLLILTFVAAYLIFFERNFQPFHNILLSLGYFGSFIAGVMFSYGFTAGPSTAIFLILAKDQNIFLAGFIGGLGALAGDLTIFKLIRSSFDDEIKRLCKENICQKINKKMPITLKKYLLPVIAGFIIASPLPDEIGVSLLAISEHVKTKAFMLISYLLNTAGIFVILMIGKAI